MEVCEYLSIRRAYYLVRQSVPSSGRLPFEEAAVLAKLSEHGGMKASDLADYQGALRPTMTHRTNHLMSMGLLERAKGSSDLRNVVYYISDDGERYLDETCKQICGLIPTGASLHRISPERVRPYLVAMGELSLSTSAIVLLCLHGAGEEGLPVSGIVKKTGLLQPTASMAVGSLEKKGLVERHLVEGEDAEGRRTSGPGTVGAEIVLTEAGAKRADEIAERVGRIVVRRRRHGACVAS